MRTTIITVAGWLLLLSVQLIIAPSALASETLNCGPHGRPITSLATGEPTCECDLGFGLALDGTRTCTPLPDNICGAHGAPGVTESSVCRCDNGFVQIAQGEPCEPTLANFCGPYGIPTDNPSTLEPDCICDIAYYTPGPGVPCSPVPDCGKHGTLSTDTGSGEPTCECEPGFVLAPSGNKCISKNTNHCGPHGRPEKNGQCRCDSGFTPNTLSGLCAPIPNCGDHGRPSSEDYGVPCECDAGYQYLPHTSACTPTPNCGEHGYPVMQPLANETLCVCDEGFKLSRSSNICEVKSNNPCGKHGVPKSNGTSHECRCDPGFKLAHSGKCEEDPYTACGLHGRAVSNTLNTPQCLCEFGFYSPGGNKPCIPAPGNLCGPHGLPSKFAAVGDALPDLICQCDDGFYSSPENDGACFPTPQNHCGPNGMLSEEGFAATEGSCVCDVGFEQIGGLLNPCVAKADNYCGTNGIPTVNDRGLASCICNPDYYMPPQGNVCIHIPDCGPNGIASTHPLTGEPLCACEEGYFMPRFGTQCRSIPNNYCGDHGLAMPQYATGSIACICEEGYTLDSDGVECISVSRGSRECGPRGVPVVNIITGEVLCECVDGYTVSIETGCDENEGWNSIPYEDDGLMTGEDQIIHPDATPYQ